MKVLGQGISLALVAAGLAAAPALAAHAAQAPAAPAAAQPSLVQKMKDTAEARSSPRVTTPPARSTSSGPGATATCCPRTDASTKATAAVKADKYLADFGAAFGAAQRRAVQRDRSRRTTVGCVRHLRPVLRGCPGLRFDAAGARRRPGRQPDRVNGYAAPSIDLETEPAAARSRLPLAPSPSSSLSPSDAASGSRAKARALKATSNDLVVYRTGAIKGEDRREPSWPTSSRSPTVQPSARRSSWTPTPARSSTATR